MINYDMVGRLRNDKLIVFGTSTTTGLKGILGKRKCSAGGGERNVSHQRRRRRFADHHRTIFLLREGLVPVLHFFTDLRRLSHRATDDADKNQRGGEARRGGSSRAPRGVARAVADRPARLTFVEISAACAYGYRKKASRPAGTITDMGASDTKGLRLTGVARR